MIAAFALGSLATWLVALFWPPMRWLIAVAIVLGAVVGARPWKWRMR